MPDASTLARTRRHLLVLAFVDEFGPLYALYTLWFSDHGITAGQTSTVFALWAAVAVVLEVPSGALADRVDRRIVIASAFALRAVGITVWLVWPTYPGVLIGASLWALHGALASGAWEALIYDQLAATGHADDYARVMARVEQASHTGVAFGIVAATALVGAGVSLAVLGWLTVICALPAAVLVSKLPAAAPADDEDDSEAEEHADSDSAWRAWWATLRSGLRTARSVPNIARLLVLGALLEGLFIVDEYVPLLARDRGASDGVVPVAVLVVWLGVIVGSEVAARRSELSPRAVAGVLSVGTLAILVALVSHALFMLALIGLGYAAMQVTWIIGDARTQSQLPDQTRATVTSVRALLGALVSTVAFVVVGALSPEGDPGAGLLAVTPVLLIVAAMTIAWLPERQAPSGAVAQ